MSAQKALQGSKTETRELLGGTTENRVSRRWPPEKSMIFTCREAARSSRTVGRKKKKKKRLMDFWSLKLLFIVSFGMFLPYFELL